MDEQASGATWDDHAADHTGDRVDHTVAAERTGVPAVDEVLDAVAALAERPVAEHVAVFESAHERLRRALDAQPGA